MTVKLVFKNVLREKEEYLDTQGYEVYISGDINQDFFRYSTNKVTSDYMDMLLHAFTNQDGGSSIEAYGLENTTKK